MQSNSQTVPVGRVAAIYRYPVKSMQGHTTDEARLWWHGLEGDRRYAFVRGDVHSNFPWLTGRQVAEMIRYIPSFVEPADVVSSPVRVRTPEGDEVEIESATLRAALAARYGQEIFLIHLGRGTFDSMGLSLISSATVEALTAKVGIPLDIRRFRPNIVLESFSGIPFEEDSWLGAQLRFGERPNSALIRIHRQNKRCAMINLDPETAEANPAVLRVVAQQHDSLTGIYGGTEHPGSIQVGDTLFLTRTQTTS